MTTEYGDFVKWSKSNDVELNLTRTQYLFAEKVLTNKELCQMLSNPGELISTVRKIQKYLKNT